MHICEKIRNSISRHKKYGILLTGMLLFLLLSQLLSRRSGWCNFYADHIYPKLCDPLSFLTGALPFALGELLMYLGALLVFAVPVLLLLCIFLRKRKRFLAFSFAFFRIFTLIVTAVLLIYTLQWLTPYRSFVLGKSEPGREDFTQKEMRILYYYIVDRINEESAAVPRDPAGNILYPSKKQAEQQVSLAMNRLASDYPRLRGYYPPIKIAWCSDVLDWMWIGGYTYPYTLEMTMNKYTSRFYFPTLYAHESSHHKGYYKEHEANFLSYLACSGSDDPLLRYSGCFYVYSYVLSAYQNTLKANQADAYYYEELREHSLLPVVWEDESKAYQETLDLYQEDTHLLEDYADEAEEISEKGWETQSEILQEYNYDGVVLLLLQYYDGILY